MYTLLLETSAYNLAQRLGIAYNCILRDIYTGVIPARRCGKRWMIPLQDERVKELFQTKESYYTNRKKYSKKRKGWKYPVVFNGKRYESQTDLAKAMNVSRYTVSFWVAKGKAALAGVVDGETDEGENNENHSEV